MPHSCPKCNRVDDSCPVCLKVKRALGQEQLGGRFPAQRLARFGVVMESDGVQIGLAVYAQVGALRQRAAQQAVGVLVDAPLPRAVGVCKIHRHPGGL